MIDRSRQPKFRSVCRALLLMILASLVMSCGQDQGAPPIPQYTIVDVLYGTDREYTGKEHPRDKYGSRRQREEPIVHYGRCHVSIPFNHQKGELESPSIWRLEFREDPEKHVVLLDGVTYPREEFLRDLAGRVAASSGKEALVFVHGYNVTFENAARRTAQMAYDLAFDGAPIFFSWPSKGDTAGYPADEEDIKWAIPHLAEFLTDVAENSGADAIHLIAHSMGNRGLTRALMNLKPEVRAKFREVILTAPDIDADIFLRDILPAIQAANSRITLYASSKDLALQASKKVHQNPRAGDAGETLIVTDGLETIDASLVETSFLGHSYYAENDSVLSDLHWLINNGELSERTWLAPAKKHERPYWVFRK